MKFRFKLETVLKIRAHEEKMEKQRLGLALNEWQVLKDQQKDLENSLTDIHSQFIQHSELDMVRMKQYYGFIHDQHTTIYKLDHEMETAEEKVNEQRKRLLEANKKTRMLEKLKEKERMRHRRDLERTEQLELNEIATQRFNRTN